MRFDTQIRDLAKSFYWQKLYSNSKKINGVNLFENISNFTGFQVLFLHWLEIYESLYKDLAMKEYINLTENVINNHLRCDAFLYWRERENEKKINELNQEIKKTNRTAKNSLKKGQKSYRIFQGKNK